MPSQDSNTVPKAVVENHSSKVPVLTEGDCTPAVLREFAISFCDYATIKKIAKDEQVPIAISCFRDFRITDLLELEDKRAAALAGTFDNLMSIIRGVMLPAEWDLDIRREIMQQKMSDDDTFHQFSTLLCSRNALLTGSKYHLADNRMRLHLKTAMVSDLNDLIIDDKTVNDETDFGKWVKGVVRLDGRRVKENARARGMFEAQQKRTAPAVVTYDARPKKLPHTNENAAPPASSLSTQGTCGGRLLLLSKADKQLLNKHHGCRTCQKFYVKHRSSDQVCTFPSADSYKPLTLINANAIRNALSETQAAKFGITRLPIKAVAAVFPKSDSENEEEGKESKSEDDLASRVSDCDQRVDLLHRSKHFLWKFLMTGPHMETPNAVHGLIDSGTHIVLIQEDLVERLGLQRFKLHEPEMFDVATANGLKSKQTKLHEYVKLRALSLDQCWESNVTHALMAPSLCVDVILGLPWLERNHIVIDAEARTVIDKRVQYNLLDPAPLPPKPSPRLGLKDCLKRTRADLGLLQAELKAVCKTRRLDMLSRNLFEPVKETDMVAAIRERIDVLSNWEALK
ncbi:unnamed protein product [Mycena citricolor]|uniref:Uncharacterized protein n=1 Tax=Mycena citricolor TaxID=2018698 RepID=A0AAD2H363_9AGAR|nr:unnamed protein product [Mycena citricolor]